MTAIYEQYVDEMRREFGYLATWLPNARLCLGDVGFLRRDRFDRITSLGSLGVSFDAGSLSAPTDLEYTSSGQVDVSWRTEAELGRMPIAGARAAVTIAFRGAHATLFQALGCKIRAVADLASLEVQLRLLAGNGQWRQGYTVLTEVVETGPATVLVSNQNGARIDFRVTGGGPVGTLPLAQAASGLSMISASGIAVRIVAPEGLTPLFRVCGLRSHRRKPPQMVFRGTESALDDSVVSLGADQDAKLRELSYEDAEVP